MPPQRTIRGTIAKAMIAFAVLLPVLFIVTIAVRHQMVIYGVRIINLTPWFLADAAILGLGLLLHRGEDL